MKTANVAEVKARFAAFVREVRNGPVIVTRHGQPAAILVRAPRDPEDLERFMIANSPVFQRIVAAADGQEGVSHSEFWRRMTARRPNRLAERAGRHGRPRRA